MAKIVLTNDLEIGKRYYDINPNSFFIKPCLFELIEIDGNYMRFNMLKGYFRPYTANKDGTYSFLRHKQHTWYEQI